MRVNKAMVLNQIGRFFVMVLLMTACVFPAAFVEAGTDGAHSASYDPSLYPRLGESVSMQTLQPILKQTGISMVSDSGQCAATDETSFFVFDASQISDVFGLKGQQLISVELGQCNQPEWVRETYLLLLQGGQIQSQFQGHCNHITAIHGNDRSQQIILACYGGAQGVQRITAEVIAYDKGELVVLKDLGQVYADDCNALGEQGVRYKVITLPVGNQSITSVQHACTK